MPVRRLIPPTPVLVVAVLFVMAALAALVVSIGGFIAGGIGAVGLAIVSLFLVFTFGMTAHSLWLRRRGARVISIVLGSMLVLLGLPAFAHGDLGGFGIMVTGIAIVLLVALPPSARDWFAGQ